jgi:uncharacterized membrane protein
MTEVSTTGGTSTGNTVNVGNNERLISGTAGAALIVNALWRRGPVSFALAAAGAALTYRAMSGHCPVYQRLRVDRHDLTTETALGGARGVRVLEEVVINRPVGEVYRFWRSLTNLPRFMSHLESVTVSPDDPKRSHWVAKGPLGTRVEWDARVIHEEENKVIGWRSEDGSEISNAGSVHFGPSPDGGTRIRVKLQYSPPAGTLGAGVASLFGKEPSQQVREDLEKLKATLER